MANSHATLSLPANVPGGLIPSAMGSLLMNGTGSTVSVGSSKVVPANPVREQMLRVERRQWRVWASAIVVTVALTLGIMSFTFPSIFDQGQPFYDLNLTQSVHALLGLVLLFDIYCIYQQLQIQRVRRQLNESERLFHLIGENAADLIAVVDAEGKRLYNSPSYQTVLGYSQEDLLHTSAMDQVHPDDRARIIEGSQEAKRTGVSSRVEYRMKHKDGTYRTMESTSSSVQNEKGEIEGLVLVNRDITERKQAEEALRQKEEQFRQVQKMEAVGRLSGGIAHDFNNLLCVIIGYADQLETDPLDSDKLRENAEQIRKAGQRAATLTRQLLAFSRQQVLQPRVLDLNAVVADMGKMVHRLIGEDIELTMALDPAIHRVKADPSQIEQVIMNLVVNARDAMPEGGKLSIATANLEMSHEEAEKMAYVQPGAYVQLTVTDTGSGMDESTVARIFEPFFTTKEKGKGTGLGLSTVYGIVKQSCGYVWVSSQPEKGTSFQILLPQVAGAVSAAPVKTQPAKAVTTARTVLVVEDEDSLRELISGLLTRSGYQVLAASTAPQALETVSGFEDPIHLLLTDIVLPGMNGLSLAKNLIASRPATRVLFMSGYSEFQSEGRGNLPSDALLLQKPFTRDGLLRSVAEALLELPAMPAMKVVS